MNHDRSLAAAVVLALLIASCGGGVGGMGGGGGPGGAVATTILAGGIYAVSGCRVGGCPWPTRCNRVTARCEWPRCGEGLPSCPTGYECDARGRCE